VWGKVRDRGIPLFLKYSSTLYEYIKRTQRLFNEFLQRSFVIELLVLTVTMRLTWPSIAPMSCRYLRVPIEWWECGWWASGTEWGWAGMDGSSFGESRSEERVVMEMDTVLVLVPFCLDDYWNWSWLWGRRSFTQLFPSTTASSYSVPNLSTHLNPGEWG